MAYCIQPFTEEMLSDLASQMQKRLTGGDHASALEEVRASELV